MNWLTETYLLVGRNRKNLFQKLNKAGISLKKIEIFDEKRAKITIDKKDASKYFAICKNSWYNKLLKIGGICAPIYKAIKMPLITLAIIFFFAFTYFFDFLYLQTVYEGDALLYQKQIEEQFELAGITKYKPFNQSTLNEIAFILQQNASISHVTVKKQGNKAIVSVKSAQTPPQKLIVLNSDFIASEDMTVLNITVYSGSAVVKKGDFVKKGELIAKASALVKEEEAPCPLILALTAECTFEYVCEYVYEINDSAKLNALAGAKLALGDYTVRSYTFKNEGKNKIKVILKYEKTLIGG